MLSWELFGLVLLIGLIWLWMDSLKAREIGIAAARAACQAEGWQLLDETVSIAKLSLAKNDDGRTQLRRAYDFEYSDTGDNRLKGGVVMLGHRVLVLNVGFPKRPPLTLVH